MKTQLCYIFQNQLYKNEYFQIDEKGRRKLEDPEFDDIQAVGENLKELAKITFIKE